MDSNLLSGLGNLGLGDLEGVSLFDNGKPKADEAAEANVASEIKEEDFLLDKTHECPICSNSFKCRSIRTGKARLIGSDMDLRAKFEGIEPLKYDVVSCPKCGFTALTRFFKPLTPGARKNVVEKICNNFKPQEGAAPLVYTYEEAIGRYKLALANAVVKMSKASEKAYICLRAGWLCRSYHEDLEAEETRDEAKIAQAKALEDEFLKNAYDGFIAARQAESFPMCGMDESTVDYLLACLAMRFEHYDVSSKMIASLLGSPSCSPRMKDKVRDLKEEVMTRMKKA